MVKKMWGENTPWKTESSWWSYIRGCLRKAWVNHPTKLKKINDSKCQIPNPNPKGKKPTVWGCQCSVCSGLFPMKDVQVDHIVPAGKLSSVEDIQGFTLRLLFVTTEDLRIVCKNCHSVITMSEKKGVSFNEANAEKIAIQLIKDKSEKIWLEERGIKPASNQKKRRAQIVQEVLENG